MSVKDQFIKLKENWLLVLILLIVLVVAIPLISGVGSSIRGLGSTSYSMDSALGGAYTESYSKMSNSYYPGTTNSFAPGVTDRLVTKNASSSIEVQRGTFNQAQSRLEDYVKTMDGYLLNASSNLNGDRKANQYYSGYYTIKVESKKYSSFVNQINNLGKVTYFNESTEDVTGEYTNLSSELKAEQDRLSRYKAMFADANIMQDKITLSDKIADEQRTIDYLQTQLENVNNQVSYSTINVSLTEKQSGYAQIAFIRFSDLIRNLVNSASLVLKIIFFLVPFGILALIIWGIVRITRRKSKPIKSIETIKRR
jgi:bacterioferritin (cytochrome b1)